MRRNGEHFIISALARARSMQAPMLFDVGANEGAWTTMALQSLPTAVVHCFEIAPPTFQRLQDNLAGLPRVHLHNFGLASARAQVELTYYPDSNTGSSLCPLPWPLKSEIVPCSVERGDLFAASIGVSAIDLLKVDTEGCDFDVLQGFAETFAGTRIRVVQFEYGKTCLPKRVLLKDFYEFLGPREFLIGRLYPTHVDYKHYDLFNDEHFRMGNYIAVRNDEHGFIRATRG
jgi:FkbM family methyltransferase